ncbi:MAG: SufD family Fe-S cluster assembly protein [Candidatus Micrarchaeota archaeon]|nr:SufD family Fe-S cluster assembly protein [Candidatus Micrarchaeota archaeon]MDE1864947.1 SufD family Fe-S cluster assembly protein [Candidatus Micrarchaeota archaeon]
MEYKAFASQALEQFKSLPDEGDELYKRYFVAMPLVEMGESISKPSVENEDRLREAANRTAEELRKKFDVVVWSGGAFVSESCKVARLLEMSDAEEALGSRMTSSREDKIAAFLDAYSSKVLLIDIPRETDASLNLMFINTSTPLPIEVMVNVGENSSLRMLEYCTSHSNQKSLLGTMHELKMAKYSKAEINIIHNESKDTNVICWTKARGEEHSETKINFVYNGGSFTRSRNKVDIAGYDARAEINELIVGAGDQKMDISSNVINSAQSSNATLESKAVLMDRSVCILKGYALIDENAAESRSYVNERGIILDKAAHIDSIPSMSIRNSNVKATHSSATAPIDEESIFYLMSRGASELEAKRMIVNGFITGIIGKIGDVLVREIVASIVNEKVTTRNFGFVPKVTTESMWLAGIAHASSSIFKGHYKYRGE